MVPPAWRPALSLIPACRGGSQVGVLLTAREQRPRGPSPVAPGPDGWWGPARRTPPPIALQPAQPPLKGYDWAATGAAQLPGNTGPTAGAPPGAPLMPWQVAAAGAAAGRRRRVPPGADPPSPPPPWRRQKQSPSHAGYSQRSRGRAAAWLPPSTPPPTRPGLVSAKIVTFPCGEFHGAHGVWSAPAYSRTRDLSGENRTS